MVCFWSVFSGFWLVHFCWRGDECMRFLDGSDGSSGSRDASQRYCSISHSGEFELSAIPPSSVPAPSSPPSVSMRREAENQQPGRATGGHPGRSAEWQSLVMATLMLVQAGHSRTKTPREVEKHGWNEVIGRSIFLNVCCQEIGGFVRAYKKLDRKARRGHHSRKVSPCESRGTTLSKKFFHICKSDQGQRLRRENDNQKPSELRDPRNKEEPFQDTLGLSQEKKTIANKTVRSHVPFPPY